MAWRMLALVAFGEFLGMTLWFSATAVAPAMSAEMRLTSGGAAWLTMSVQAGFVVGTLASALANLPDLLSARRLVGLGCFVGAVANALVTTAGGAGGAIGWRFVTGAALACVYPPGMKLAASWFDRRRGSALGALVGALTIGSAVPHLLVWMAAGFDWRLVMRVASGLALVGGALVWLLAQSGPFVADTSSFDPRAATRVFINRGTRLATLGYLGHMWELYAMWTWIAAFAAASLAGGAGAASLVAFVAIASGALGCVVAGMRADRVGKARVARTALLTSAACAAGAGLLFGRGSVALYALAIVWGFSVVADSAQFSALVAEYSPRDHVGTALTVQTCAGFLLTMVTIRLLPVVANQAGWRWAFLALAPGPLLGAWAMAKLVNPHFLNSPHSSICDPK